MDPPKKRGHGRPRKNPVPESIPEEPTEPVLPQRLETVMLDSAQIDLSDIARKESPPAPPAAEPVVEPEEIRLPDFMLQPEILCSTATGPVAATAPSKHVVSERANTISKIKKYRQNFEAIRAMNFDERNMTDEQLESLLNDIRITILSKNTSLVFKTAYVTSVKGFDFVGGRVGLKCYGLADLLSKNPQIDDILRECEAELGIGYIQPLQRLAFVTLTSAVALHGMNARAELLNKFGKEAAQEGLVADYKDL